MSLIFTDELAVDALHNDITMMSLFLYYITDSCKGCAMHTIIGFCDSDVKACEISIIRKKYFSQIGHPESVIVF